MSRCRPPRNADQADRPDDEDIQIEQRKRRRTRQHVVLGRRFDLMREIFDIADPFAKRVAVEPIPAVFLADVVELADSVHALIVEVSGLIVSADARRAAAHLKSEDRARAVRMMVELAERPAVLTIEGDTLASGTWVAALTAFVGPYSGQLSDLLGRALPPDAVELRGSPSVSERVVRTLRVVDQAAISLEQRLGKAALYRKSARHSEIQTDPDAVRAELSKMGVQI